MVKSRGKGNKKFTSTAGEDGASGDEEKIPVRRRGRPQKPIRDNVDEEEEFEKMEEDEEEEEEERKGVRNTALSKRVKKPIAGMNGRKRKRAPIAKKNLDLVKEENGLESKTEVTNAVGLKQHGSRRKSKPHRAAEVGVECI